LTVSIFPREKELYIPSIFNKLCIKMEEEEERKMREANRETNENFASSLFPSYSQIRGNYKSLLLSLQLVKLN
jgi:hypothetical protein